MKGLVKELRKMGFMRVFTVPLGFEEAVERVKPEVRKYEIVAGGAEFPQVDGKYLVRYLGQIGDKHYWLVGKKRHVGDE